MSRRKQQPVEKHNYSPQEIVFSSGWVTSDFRLADRNRQIERDERKQQDSKTLGLLYGIIEDENIVSLAHFVKIVYTQFPELAPVYSQKAAQIRDYINSRRFDISCGFVDMPYNKVCEALKHEQKHNADLEDKISHYVQLIDQNRKVLKSNEMEIAQLKQSVYELQLFSQRLLKRNQELLNLLEFEELPCNSETSPIGLEINPIKEK